MKYIVAILMGALLIGSALVFVVDIALGSNSALFVAKFTAGPVGLLIAWVLFLAFDSIWPK